MKSARGIRQYFLIIAILNLFAASAQNVMEVGVEAGPAVAAFNGGPQWYGGIQTTKTTFATGIAAQYDFKKKYAVRAVLIYERKGSQTQTNVQVNDPTGEKTGSVTARTFTDLDYLVMPLMLRASYGKNVKFFVNGGPYIAYLLSGSITYKPDVVQNRPVSKYDLETMVNRFDYGFSGGLGGAIPFRKHYTISMELRETFGMNRLYSSGPNSFTLKTINLVFGLQYKF